MLLAKAANYMLRDRILFGSVAEKVVKNATMPVLTVRPTEDASEA